MKLPIIVAICVACVIGGWILRNPWNMVHPSRDYAVTKPAAIKQNTPLMAQQ